MLRSKVTLLFLAFAVAMIVFPAMASAEPIAPDGTTAASLPTITSDKADYAPGELITLTGGNWQPGESVNIKVNDDAGQTWSRNVDVNADESGNISDSFNLPDWFVATYSVTATGAQSGVATTSFTDGNVQVRATDGSNALAVQFPVGSVDGFNNTGCTGASPAQSNTDAFTTLTNNNFQNSGVTANNSQSVKLDAPSPVTIGGQTYNFSSWTGTASSDNLVVSSTGCISRTAPGSGTNDPAWNITANYTDVTAPQVVSINRVDPSPTNLNSVRWTVTFSENVTGVNAADFTLANTGLGGTPAITGVTGSNATYTVTASTGSGDGTLGLNLVDDNSIADTSSSTNKLGGAGAGDGNFTGQVYTIGHTAPTVTAVVPTENATNVNVGTDVSATFSKDMNASTITTGSGGTFTLRQGTASGTIVSSALSYDVPTKTATLNPNANLLNNQQYTAVLTNGVKDLAGNAIAAKTWTFTTGAANTAPVAQPQPSVSTNEDTAKTITLTGTDADGNNLTFSIVNGPTNGSLGSIGAVTCSGTAPKTCSANVTYTPTGNYNGGDSFIFKANDGTADSNLAPVSITVNPVNDAPSFTKGADQTVNEDAGLQTVSPWATNISKGPANESTQTVSFEVTNNTNTALFSTQPSVAPNGDLTYTPADNASGTATVSVKIKDDGGTANGGVNESAVQTFTITVNAVNDAPTISNITDQTILEDGNTGALAFTVNDVDNPVSGLTPSGSSSDTTLVPNANITFGGSNGNRTVTVTPAANRFGGPATITVTVSDGDKSATDTFDLRVTPVNDEPSFDVPANAAAVNEDAGTQTINNFATNISAGPFETQALNFVVTNGNNDLFETQPAISPSGDLTYKPAANANGTALVSVKLQDDGGTLDGGDNESQTKTFTITVNAVNDAPVVTFTNPAGDTQTLDEDKTATRLYTYTVTDVDNASPTVNESCGSGSLKPDESGDPQNSFRCLFADDATTTVSATANDGEASNNIGSDSIAVKVNNVAPKVNLSGLNTANEGDTNTYSFTITDPGADTFHFTAGYPTCGAHGNLVGTPDIADGQFQCFFPDGDTSTTTDVALKVTDDDNGESVADTEHVEIINVQVANVKPTVTAPSNQTASEGASASFSLGTFSDPGTDSPWTVDVDWGDGSSTAPFQETATGAASNQAIAAKSHTYADNGNYTVTVKVTDKNGGYDTKTFQVTVSNADPTATLANNGPVAEGSPATVSFTNPSDPSGADTTAGFHYAYDCNNGSLAGATYAGSGTAASTNCTFNDNGNKTVRARIIDKDGGFSEYTTTVSVTNAPPSVTKPADQTATEGTSKSFNLGSFSDPGADSPWAVDVDWGDGSPHDTFNETASGPATSKTITAKSHTYADEGTGTYTVTVKVTDKDGDYQSKSFSVTVANALPVVNTPTLTDSNGGVSCLAGNSVNLSSSFSDAGSLDTHSATIDWGDGDTTTGTVNSATRTVTGQHTYSGLGPYPIKVTVTDNDGGSGQNNTASKSFHYNVGNTLLQPVNDTSISSTATSLFKVGSTIPLKVNITDCNGVGVAGLSPTIKMMLTSSSTPLAGVDEGISTQPNDTNWVMRSGDVSGQYIYNLASKSLPDSSATYKAQITVNGYTVTTQNYFGLKAK